MDKARLLMRSSQVKKNKEQSTEEVTSGHKVNLKHLRVFRCVSYPHQKHRKLLNQRSIKSICSLVRGAKIKNCKKCSLSVCSLAETDTSPRIIQQDWKDKLTYMLLTNHLAMTYHKHTKHYIITLH